jgi:hypothetical protein
VNISSRELLRQGLGQEVRSILRQQLIEDGCLRLEVTEALVMENPERAMEMLTWLKEAGAGLSLDDFGIGYSSLTYLKQFPFDTIKIDRSLIQDESADEHGAVIVRSIVAMAQELERNVVAEGVDTPEMAAVLRELGCGQAQGQFFGEPILHREVLDLLKIVRKSERNPERRGFRFWRRGKKDDEQPEKATREVQPATGSGNVSVGTLRPAPSTQRPVPDQPQTPAPHQPHPHPHPQPQVQQPPQGQVPGTPGYAVPPAELRRSAVNGNAAPVQQPSQVSRQQGGAVTQGRPSMQPEQHSRAIPRTIPATAINAQGEGVAAGQIPGQFPAPMQPPAEGQGAGAQGTDPQTRESHRRMQELMKTAEARNNQPRRRNAVKDEN